MLCIYHPVTLHPSLLLLAILFAFFSHLLHKADVVILGQVSVFEEIGPIMCGHSFDQMLNHFIRDEGMAKIKLCHIGLYNTLVGERTIKTRVETYLAIGNFLETLEDLLSGVLILGYADHESNELLEANPCVL